MFFVSHDGTLLVRNVVNPHLPTRNPDPKVREKNVRWEFAQEVNDVRFVAVVDAQTLKANTVFAVDTKGSLSEIILGTTDDGEHLQELSFINDLGHPKGTTLSPLEGVAIADVNAVGSLFMRAENGHLVELWWARDGQTVSWVDHKTPAKGVTLATPPGALINNRSIFMVTSEGRLVERYWDGEKWIWVNHGRPVLPGSNGGAKQRISLASVRGVSLDSRTLFWVLEDGRLGERSWNGEKWVWAVHEVPEGRGSSLGTKYCSSQRNTPDSCMPLDLNLNQGATIDGLGLF